MDLDLLMDLFFPYIFWFATIVKGKIRTCSELFHTIQNFFTDFSSISPSPEAFPL